ncbi:MAG: 6-carboxytetrahydropterin synthase [Acidobacteriaceae bacterium]|nr:6-carboxytetrahydropterin synthase [Acidobacteriaceae bacterium]MBV9500529.1 6-carboxytetrahydropterin synthase [Acidobacteriaceae bacterium]
MLLTRRAEFSASHFCRIPSLSEVENREIFGEEANLNGHGHNYIVEVTVEGEPDPVTGIVMDLKEMKRILDREIVEPMDHRFLNLEIPPFQDVIPTTANLAREIWRRLQPFFSASPAMLSRVRLYETADLYVDIVGEDGA